MVLCKSAAEEISFEWSYHEIFITNSLRAAVQTVCRYVCHNKTFSPFSYTWAGHLAYSLANSNACERQANTTFQVGEGGLKETENEVFVGKRQSKIISSHFENWLHLFFFFFYPRLEKLWWSRKPPKVIYPFLGKFTWLATAVYSDQEEVILCSLEVKMS